MLHFLRWLASRLPRRLITGEDDTPYLSRYRVLGWMPGDKRRWPFSIYLHHFHRPDLDEALHNHPWRWALSIVLTGGYCEARSWGAQWRKPFTVELLRADTYHSITRLQGEVWTLFIVGPKAQSWGFLVSGRGHVPWRKRFAERGIPATEGGTD